MIHSKIRFVVTLTLLLIFGFVATSLIGYTVARSSLAKQIAETALPLTGDNIYSEIQQDLLRPVFISSLMAQDTFVRDWVLAGEREPRELIRYLSEIKERYGTITAFFVSDRTLRYYHSSGVLKTVSPEDAGDKWFFRVRNLHQPYEINVDADTADRRSTTIFVNYRVTDFNGKFIGVTGVGLAIESVRKMIETYQLRYGRRVYFTDREGRLMLHGSSYAGATELRLDPGLATIATQILTTPSGSYTFRRHERTVYLNSRLVPEFNWYLLVEEEDDPSGTPVMRALMINLAVSLGVTVVVLVLAHLTIGTYQNRLEEMATTDKLTGAANRQFLEAILDQTLKTAKRRSAPVSVLIGDIDHFKRINDTHGHLAGDAVLRAVAGTIRELIRESDTLCRWGGEEFLVLAPDCDLNDAQILAEKIRAALSAHPIAVDEAPIEVTASFGVARFRAGESADSLFKRADDALYVAKQGGRNRVEVAP